MKQKVCGIYRIVNKKNGKVYVGSTNNSRLRWNNHKCLLDNNKHHCCHLQRAWKKYGKNNFEFILVKECSEEDLLSLEQTYLDIAKNNRKKYYNVMFEAACPAPYTDKTIYTFYHEDGSKFTGIRMDFCKKYSLCRAGVRRVVQQKQKTYKGWGLSKQEQQEHTLYHKNGTTLTGTKEQLIEQIKQLNYKTKMSARCIVRSLLKKERKIRHDWSLSPWDTQRAKVVHQ